MSNFICKKSKLIWKVSRSALYSMFASKCTLSKNTERFWKQAEPLPIWVVNYNFLEKFIISLPRNVTTVLIVKRNKCKNCFVLSVKNWYWAYLKVRKPALSQCASGGGRAMHSSKCDLYSIDGKNYVCVELHISQRRNKKETRKHKTCLQHAAPGKQPYILSIKWKPKTSAWSNLFLYYTLKNWKKLLSRTFE